MSRAKFRVLILAVALAVMPGLPVHADDIDRDMRYQTELMTAKSAAAAGSEAIDWQTLRFDYVDRPSYSMHATNDDRHAMFAAMQAKDWQKVSTNAQQVLSVNFSDGLAHLAEGIAQGNLGHEDVKSRELAMAKAIFHSMETGDGLTPATAFTVAAVSEEYDLMAYYGRDVGMQSLSSSDSHSYDVLETTGESGDKIVYYFNIDRIMAAEMALFSN